MTAEVLLNFTEEKNFSAKIFQNQNGKNLGINTGVKCLRYRVMKAIWYLVGEMWYSNMPCRGEN